MKSEWTWRGVSAALAGLAVWAAMSGQPKQEALKCALKASEAQVAFSEEIKDATTKADKGLQGRKAVIVKAKLADAGKLKEIIEREPQVTAWANEPVPADVIIWVRQTPNPARSGGNP